MMSSTYGKKGQTGANRNKRASTYLFTLPDGTTGRKKSFNVHLEQAVTTCFQNVDGKWCPAGIYESQADFERMYPQHHFTIIPSQRLK